MNYTKKELAKNKIQYKVVLNSVDLAVPRQKAVERLAKNIKIPGFRAGKVPAHIAEKHINPNTLAEEVLKDSINRALVEVIVKEQTSPLDQPKVNVTKIVPFDLIEFTIEMEIVPPVKLGKYMTLRAKKENLAVKDSDVDAVVNNLQKQFAGRKAIKRAIAEGDEVFIDFTGFKDKKEFDGGAGKNMPLIIGSKQFIPGFEEGLIGHKDGDKFDLALTFPKDYQATHLKGASVVFKIKINKVNEVKMPEIDDDFAKLVTDGQIKDIKALREDIKRELTSRAEFDSVERFKAELLKELVEKSTVEAPKVLIDDQINALEEDFKNNLKYRGISEEQYFAGQGYKDRDDWKKKELIPQAEQRVKNGLVLAELARTEKIEVSDDEINERQKLIMEQYSDPSLKARFESPEFRNDLRGRLATEKALNKLVSYNS